MRCDTGPPGAGGGPPYYSVARAWYDYPDLNSIPAINYRDRLPVPDVTFSPSKGAMVVDLETWPTLADYGNVDIREDFVFYNFQARPRTLVWDPGDGSRVVRCPIPEPRPGPGARLGDRCAHVYKRPSIVKDDRAPDAFRSIVTVEYDIYAQINGGGWDPVAEDYAGQQAVELVPVREIQAVAD